jgi:anti-sigma-K factor RskA
VDKKEFIESGLLELYVVGQVTEAERREVERMVTAFPEVAEELSAIEASLRDLAIEAAVAPSPELKGRILQAVDPEPERGTQSGAGGAGRASKASVLRNLCPFLAAACLLGAVFLFFKFTEFRSRSSELEMTVAELQTENRQLQEKLAAIRGEGAIPVALKGTGQYDNALCLIYYNPEMEKVLLNLTQLPELSGDEDFQLWGIRGDEKVSLGVFSPSSLPEANWLEASFLETPDAFGITIEPKGGSEQPTLSRLVVIGNV